MAAWITKSGEVALQALLIFFGAMSILVFARDGFHVFLHDAFNWLVVLSESIVGAIFGLPAIQEALEKLLNGVQSLLSILGISVDLVLQSHWKHAFVLLYLGFSGYAHAFKDFEAKFAASLFRYANGLVSAFLGGLMAGTVHLAHTGVVAWPVVAFLLFQGLNWLWRCVFVVPDLLLRAQAFMIAVSWLSAAGLIALYVLGLENTNLLPGDGPSPGLVLVALAVAGGGVWATVFGFGAQGNAAAPTTDAPQSIRQRLNNPGRKMGLRVLATLGLAALVAGLGQAAWGITRERSTADAGGLSDVFRDCLECPEMAPIPDGAFTMGTTEAQKAELQALGLWDEERQADQLPAREIAVSGFALARTEVTIAQFQAFMDATGYRPSGVCWGVLASVAGLHERSNWRHPGYDQGPDHPVVCVTWWDAQAYARWLSLKTGETYRLPTEAEWEYAARARATTLWSWGSDANAACQYANLYDRALRSGAAVTCSDGVGPRTAPVGSYRANAFGLYDMHGNVGEWVQDCYSNPYPSTPVNGSAYEPRGCSRRVLRGGSWSSNILQLRLAERARDNSTQRNSFSGFRVARTL